MSAMEQIHSPGKNGCRLAENLVIRRLSAAKVIVIHTRQIVVYERIGMNELQRTGKL